MGRLESLRRESKRGRKNEKLEIQVPFEIGLITNISSIKNQISREIYQCLFIVSDRCYDILPDHPRPFVKNFPIKKFQAIAL